MTYCGGDLTDNDVVVALQTIASGAFSALLIRQPYTLPAPLLSTLSPHLAQLDAQDKMTARAVLSAQKRFLMTRPAMWSPYQQSMFPVMALLPRWRRFYYRIAHRFRRQTAVTVAPYLLPALGQTAWASLSFRRFISVQTFRFLRTRELMTSSPNPVLSDPFWWTLLSLTQGPVEAIAAFERQANRSMHTDNWATFWDQYFLRLAAANGLTLPPAIAALPLCQAGAPALKSNATKDVAAAKTGWRDGAPAWAMPVIERRI